MFGHRYFGARYFAPAYFGDGDDTAPPEPVLVFIASAAFEILGPRSTLNFQGPRGTLVIET